VSFIRCRTASSMIQIFPDAGGVAKEDLELPSLCSLSSAFARANSSFGLGRE